MAPMKLIQGEAPQPCDLAVNTPGASEMMRPGMKLPAVLGTSAWEDGDEACFGSINQMPWAKLIRDHTSLSSSTPAAPSVEV